MRDPVSDYPQWDAHLKMSTFYVMFYFLFSGIQTQAYRPVDLVLFTESGVREILAQDNERQSKGKFCSLFIVTAVFAIITHCLIKEYVRYLDNLSSNSIKSVGFNNYLKMSVFYFVFSLPQKLKICL